MDITKLRSTIKGQVITPGDETYEKDRRVFSGHIDKKPAVIIMTKDESDVVEAIRLAKETGLEFAVRSGGHSILCTNDNGIVLDLRNLNSLEIDQEAKTAWVGPGMTAGAYSEATGKYGLVTGFGDTGSVGVGGISLGGGIGFLVRKFGMAIDNLLAAEIVTADGEKLSVDEDGHPDLFWAIRGGGGNFGVATRFKFRLQELPEAYGGMLVLPAEPEVLARFMDLAGKAPDELSVILNVMGTSMPMPFLPDEFQNKTVLMALMMYAGPADEGEKVLKSFRDLAKPLADMLKPMKYHEIYMPEDENYRPTAASWNMHMKKFDRDIAQQIIDELDGSDAMMRAVQLRPLGGAMARVPEDATAYAHRKSPIMVNIACFYNGPEDRKVREEWVEHMAKSLYQGDDAVYVGFLNEDGARRIHHAYPEKHWQRLQEVKAKYDPDNLFKLNQNIAPGNK